MIESLFFDTDCLCAFLWTRNECLLDRLYPGRIVVPQPVYAELCRPGIPHLRARVDAMLIHNTARLQEIGIDSEEYDMYYRLTETPPPGHKIIGNGEAAAISLAKQYGGIVASNNLRDVSVYLSEFNLKHMTTGKILTDAYQRGWITEADGNAIWLRMLEKRRKLGAASFTEYLLKNGFTPLS